MYPELDDPQQPVSYCSPWPSPRLCTLKHGEPLQACCSHCSYSANVYPEYDEPQQPVA
jgi:hypothetical protein